jgi:hypothetical protein
MAKTTHDVNRRKILAWGGAIGAALLGGGTLVRWFQQTGESSGLEQFHENLLEHTFEKYTTYEATVLHEVAGLIIPADLHPGAKEAMVVLELDQIAKHNERFHQLCHRGVQWLDDMAQDMSQVSNFLDLALEAQMKVLLMADSEHISLWEKVSDKLRYGETHIGHRFFHIMKRHTFAVFYTHPLGWMTLGYHGPPQWSGHLDYHICV